MNSSNREYQAVKGIRKIVLVSIILISAGGILNIFSNYIINLMFLSSILAITGVFIYILCLLLLFKRKEEPEIREFGKKMLWGIVMIIIIYLIAFR